MLYPEIFFHFSSAPHRAHMLMNTEAARLVLVYLQELLWKVVR